MKLLPSLVDICSKIGMDGRLNQEVAQTYMKGDHVDVAAACEPARALNMKKHMTGVYHGARGSWYDV